ncbi:hypothetical protein [Mariniplasma anaerobium]|uniref:Uncharacterized protein n=1 Tax=Mariniplasma anaerobium TaxID=2735436 RepID=A0A7U9TLD2_9MOLU|nr:hypothetical protein [Mariniplasma anaerobium]BCR35363.1 hypothetical protein MPAN_002560 [Mariniplasma anaerobium]
MKYKTLQFIIVIGILVCFFLPMFNVEEESLTGIQAIYSGNILLFGNIIIGVVFLTTIAHLIFMIFGIFKKEQTESMESTINIVVNISLIAGLLMVTFLGWYTNIVAIICVILMIGSAYVRYKFL